MKIKILICLLLVISICLSYVVVDATSDCRSNCMSNTNFLDRTLCLANCRDTVSGTSSGEGEQIGNTINSIMASTVVPIIEDIGNLVFAAVTVILGVKYIFSSAQGRAGVLESLPAYLTALIFFYLASSLLGFVYGTFSFVQDASDFNTISGRVLWLINTVVRYLAFGGLLFIGLKYMLASAEGKASVKANFGGLAIGILFVFSASSIINFIVNTGRSIL